MFKTQKFLFLLFLTIIPTNSYSQSKDFIQWHSSNIQYLRGWDYELGEKQRTIITFEHANKWKFGDFYMFIDGTGPDDGGNKNLYAEFSPRFSLSKLSGYNFSNDFISDISISTTIEKTKNTGIRYLYGGAIDVKIHGFKYFKNNFYIRDDSEVKGKTWQITLAWNLPFKISDLSFLIEGFADITGREGNKTENQLIVPRFLLDIGHLSGLKENKLWAGVELQSWHNKFGVKGKSETVPQLQFKYIF